MQPLIFAQLFPIGCHPVVALILTILIAGAILYFAEAILGFAEFIKGRFKAFALLVIKIACYVWIVVAALYVVFGITLFGLTAPLAC